MNLYQIKSIKIQLEYVCYALNNARIQMNIAVIPKSIEIVFYTSGNVLYFIIICTTI